MTSTSMSLSQEADYISKECEDVPVGVLRLLRRMAQEIEETKRASKPHQMQIPLGPPGVVPTGTPCTLCGFPLSDSRHPFNIGLIQPR